MQDVHQIEAFRTPDHVELTEFMAIDLDLLQNCATARYCKKSNLEVQGEINWMLCIADLMCGPVRTSPGGRVAKIVAAGGCCSATDKVEVYDIATNTWEEGE